MGWKLHYVVQIETRNPFEVSMKRSVCKAEDNLMTTFRAFPGVGVNWVIILAPRHTEAANFVLKYNIRNQAPPTDYSWNVCHFDSILPATSSRTKTWGKSPQVSRSLSQVKQKRRESVKRYLRSHRGQIITAHIHPLLPHPIPVTAELDNIWARHTSQEYPTDRNLPLKGGFWRVSTKISCVVTVLSQSKQDDPECSFTEQVMGFGQTWLYVFSLHPFLSPLNYLEGLP